MLLLGTALNAGGILIGGIVGLLRKRPMKEKTQLALKSLIGVATVVIGLGTCWIGLSGNGVGGFFKFLLIAILSMMAGRITGRLVRLQRGLNKLGQFAGGKVGDAASGKKLPWSDGFLACAILFCLPPLGVFGAVLDGVAGRWQPLAVKAAMDALATMAFVRTFGWSAIAAVLPATAFLGSITLGSHFLTGHILNASMINALQATAGLLVFCVALIVLEFRKVELADYLPSLLWAPLLAWVWK